MPIAYYPGPPVEKVSVPAKWIVNTSFMILRDRDKWGTMRDPLPSIMKSNNISAKRKALCARSGWQERVRFLKN